MRESEELKMKAVFEVLEYLLIAGALMGVGAGVMKYAALITPEHPISSHLAAAVIMLVGLGLSLWAVFYGVHKFAKVFGSRRWQAYASMVLLLLSWGYVVSALFFMAINA